MNAVLGLDSRDKLVSWCMLLMFHILANTLGIKLKECIPPSMHMCNSFKLNTESTW